MQPEGGLKLLVKGERQSTGLEIVRALSYAKESRCLTLMGMTVLID